ncbi:MAG: XdhC family protein [Coriobacteriales bacterium]|jgi:xanthine dehydrogenase accessory factor
MEHVFEEMARRLGEGERFGLAVICVSDGSTPRKVGSKMLVDADGSIFATIGGGSPEAAAIDACREALESGRSSVLYYDFGEDDVNVAAPICGGSGSVAICVVDGAHKPVVDALVEGVAEGRDMQFALHVADGRCDLYCVDVETKQATASAGADIDEDLAVDIVKQFHDSETFDSADADEVWHNERVRSEGHLYLIGGGHVSLATEAAARVAGFSTVVIDDRVEFANAERFPNARCIAMPGYEDLSTLKIRENDYIAIMTRGHSYDRECLMWALGTPAGYIGMIGSKRKCGLVYDRLREDGYSEEAIASVHGPIGLPIGGNTPGEIAISIVAQLVQERPARAERAKQGTEA